MIFKFLLLNVLVFKVNRLIVSSHIKFSFLMYFVLCYLCRAVQLDLSCFVFSRNETKSERPFAP